MKAKLVGLVLLAATLFHGVAAQAQQYDRRVTIVNAATVTMTYFYASNVDRTTWEEDIFGNSVLPAGYSVVVNVDDGSGYCMFDFRAVFADGSEAIQYGVNVCEVSTFTFTD